MDFGFSVFATAGAWISLLTLTFLEIVLGIDNVIFISIAANALPKNKQQRARSLGLVIALFFRIALLVGISYIIRMTTPIISLFGNELSGRDLILIGGGLFLLVKSTTEIHKKMEGNNKPGKGHKSKSAFWKVVGQIIFFDIIFSFDSILTAVGLTPYVMIIILAILISVFVMLKFSGPLSNVIDKYPTLQILALSFLIMIGLTLILEGFGVHVNKAFIYVAVLFSLAVEGMNIRFMNKNRP